MMTEIWDNPLQLKNMMSDILQEAAKQGATSAEVDLGVNKGFSVSARMGDVESVEYNQDKLVDITVYFGQRSGSASLSDLRPDAIRSAIEAACNIARFTDEDNCAGLADKEMMAFNYPEPLLSYPWDISVEQAIELAKECEAKALAADKQISQAEGVTVSTGIAWSAYGNSHGFLGLFPVTRHEISCVLVAKRGSEMQRDYSYTVSCDPTLLDSISKVAEEAAQKSVRRLGARHLKTCQVPVVFIAEQARSLLGSFVSAISGGSIYRKASFLVDQLGKPIFPAHINMMEHPHLVRGLGSAPFDDDGVATRDNVFIESGILKNYVLGTYSARKLGMKSTGNSGGVHNLSITTGQSDLAALLKKMGTGLLVTELMGNGVNLITGDYSRGATGFWVENGVIQYAVEEITIAGNLRDIYANLVEVGCDVDLRGNIHTGSILLEKMTVAGK